MQIRIIHRIIMIHKGIPVANIRYLRRDTHFRRHVEYYFRDQCRHDFPSTEPLHFSADSRYDTVF